MWHIYCFVIDDGGTKMAEEQKKQKTEDQKKQKAVENEEPQGEGKKKNIVKLIILIVLFMVVAGGGAAGYFFYGKQIMSKFFHKQPQDGAEQTGETGEPGDKEANKEKKKEVIGPILTLEPFIFNMSGNQSKYAKVSLGIEFKDPKIMEEAKKMMPAIRDKILSVLGTKAPEVLMDVNQRNSIKSEIQTNLKTLFEGVEDLKAVYITDIIIQ
jgi:flagellar protein FliL